MVWFLVVFGLAVVVSLLRGGRISNISEIRLRGWWLLFVGFGMQIAAGFLDSHWRFDPENTAVREPEPAPKTPKAPEEGRKEGPREY